jgi:hypothetical protein
MEVRVEYQIKMSKRFAALEKLNESQDIFSACENVTNNIKISAEESLVPFEWKHRKPCFHKEF